jgi:hypothetical protein
MGTTTSPNLDVVYLTPTVTTLPTVPPDRLLFLQMIGVVTFAICCRAPVLEIWSTQAKRIMQMVPTSRL